MVDWNGCRVGHIPLPAVAATQPTLSLTELAFQSWLNKRAECYIESDAAGKKPEYYLVSNVGSEHGVVYSIAMRDRTVALEVRDEKVDWTVGDQSA